MVFKVKRQSLGVVASFEYLGATVSDEGSKLERFPWDSRRGPVLVWRDWSRLGQISTNLLAELTRFLIMSMFLCACGSWALIAELQKGPWAFEMGTEHLVREPCY